MGNWKLVAKGSFGTWELFDLESDRSELNDLADLYPNRVAEMSQKWEEWAIETHVKPWPWKQKKNKSKGKKKEVIFLYFSSKIKRNFKVFKFSQKNRNLYDKPWGVSS